MQLFLTSLHTPYISDLGDEAKRLSPQEVLKKLDGFLESVAPLPQVDVYKEGLQGVYEMICQDAISRDHERSLFVKEIAKLKTPQAYWEFLTKMIAGRDLEEGMLIPALGGEEFYYIYKKISQKGLMAYALKPLHEKSDLKPVLFFRPTQMSLSSEKMVETLMDNFSLNGVGYDGFSESETELNELMREEGFRSPQDKILVAGYSLGGVHAQRFLANGDNWKHFSEAIIFNSSAIDEKTASSFAFKVNMGSFLLRHTPSLLFFRTKGDLIDQGGDYHLGSGVFPFSNIRMNLIRVLPFNKLDNCLTRHLTCYLNEETEIEVLDVKSIGNHHLLNNIKEGKEKSFLEKARKSIAFLFIPIYYSLFFFTWLSNIIFLQQTTRRIRLLLGSTTKWMQNKKE